MRLWHYSILPVLDNKHLISQWRECIAIKRQWEKGTLKHRLVSYVMNYDKRYLVKYTGLIYNEMCKRNIKCRDCYWIEMIRFCGFEEYYMSGMYTEHNDRYLKQCYYNLQEKADRGIINTEEWEKIEEWKKSKNI